MKVRFLDRLLMALYALLGLLLSLGLGALIAVRESFALDIGRYRVTMPHDMVSTLIIAAAALVLLLWSIRILALALRHESKVDKTSVSVQNTENGSVRVSVQAMDMLVRRAVSNTEGVADVKTSIVNHEDSISVHVDMTLNSDVYIPNVTMLMQRNIKSFIEEYSGIAVREVTVMVSKIIEVQPKPPLQIPESISKHMVIDQDDIDVAETDIETDASDAFVEEEPEAVDMEADKSVDTDDGEAEGEQPAEESSEHADGDADDAISEKDIW